MSVVSTYLWKNIGIFSLTGVDTERYLHGRCSQDIKSLTNNQSKLALILSPQGKIEGKFLVVRNKDQFILLTDPLLEKTKESFLSSLLRFKVADRFDINDLSQKSFCISFFGDNVNEVNQKIEDLLPIFSESGFDVLVFKSERANLVSQDMFCRINTNAELNYDKIESILENNVEVINEADFLERRIKSFYLLSEVDIDPSIIAPEIPLSQFISLGKGCYAGQEVVEMTTARGRPNRKVVLFQGNELLGMLQKPISVLSTDGNTIGSISSYIDLNDSFIGLGFIKTKFSESKDAHVIVGDRKVRISFSDVN